VQPTGCPPIPHALVPLNGAAVATVAKDYRQIVPADATGAGYFSSPFCVDVDYLAPFLVRTAPGAIYRVWTASNDAASVRLEYALLTTVPVAIFANGFE
jgi:hypothetical protein